MVKKLTAWLLLISASSLISSKAFAYPSGKYVLIVNPVREKNHWRSFESVMNQIKVMEETKEPVTWLLQYGVLKNKEALSLFRNVSSNNEIGVLLEVNQQLARDSSVGYLEGDGDWARADKVFLSGYAPDARKRMMDRLFDKFKEVLGEYPKSVGAWYIDTDSLNYLVSRYQITSVMEVADQYKTDKYGVWGKPWGVPYFPSKYNSFLPSKSKEDQLDVVTIQWAARDPVLGYGLTVSDSTYSVQANDYIDHHDLDINYFQRLADSYLSSPNELTELTIGLEAGQEGAKFIEELSNQIIRIKKSVPGVTFLSMSDFAAIFKKSYPDGNPNLVTYGGDQYREDRTAYWFSSPYFRAAFLKDGSQFLLRDLRIYDTTVFYDFFDRDQKENLLREIPACVDALNLKNQKLIIDNLERVELSRKDNNIEFMLMTRNGLVTKIVLSKENFSIDGKNQLMKQEGVNLKRILSKNFLDNFLAQNINTNHDFRGGVRYSRLKEASFYGLMLGQKMLIGINSRFPYFGFFSFPFETLSYFKTPPEINFAKIMFKSFDPGSRECTINL